LADGKEVSTVTIPLPKADGVVPLSDGAGVVTLSMPEARAYAKNVRVAISEQRFADLPMLETGVVANFFTGQPINDEIGANLSLKLWRVPDNVPILGQRALFGTAIGVSGGRQGGGFDVSMNRLDQNDNGMRVGLGYTMGDGRNEFAFYLRKTVDLIGLFRD
jgi:hypothetical protein